MTSAADFLNADLTTVGRRLLAGLAWWGRELAEMVPAPLRGLAETRPSLTAARGPDGGYDLVRGGRRVVTPPRSARVTLLLPAETVLTREIALPAMSNGDARRLIALDIDRLTPFHPGAVHVAVAFPLGAADAAGRRLVRVAAVARASADQALDQARAAGLDPRAVGVAGDPDGFDFLPALRAARGEAASNRGRLHAWGAVALLLAVNLAVAIGRDVVDVRRLQATVDAQRGPRDEAVRLRRQVLTEAARRILIARGRGEGEPLRAIDAVSRALPDGAWAQRLSWNGQAVRLAGYRREDVDVIAALRASPRFKNVRNSSADPLARMAAGQPFDVTADIAETAP